MEKYFIICAFDNDYDNLNTFMIEKNMNQQLYKSWIQYCIN